MRPLSGVYVSRMAAVALQLQSQAAAVEIGSPAKAKIFTNWLFAKKSLSPPALKEN